MATSYYLHPANVLSRTAPANWTYAWDVNSPNPEGISSAGEPGADGGSGARMFSASLNVASASTSDGSGVFWNFNVYRCDAAGSVQAQASILGPMLGAVGTFTASGSADLGTFAPGDRFRIMHFFDPESMKGSNTLSIEFGPSSSIITAPWTLAPPPPARRPIRTVQILRL